MLAHAEPRVADRADPHAPQPHHRVADRLAHVAHLPRAALVQHDRQQRLILPCAQPRLDQRHVRRRRAAALDDHAVAQAVERAAVRQPAHADVVLALHLVARVHQPLGQLAVVRQQQQSL
jgi:hypothetical protein